MKLSDEELYGMKVWIAECAASVDRGLPLPEPPSFLSTDLAKDIDFSDVTFDFDIGRHYQVNPSFKHLQ